MGLWGFVKSIFGFREKSEEYAYGLPMTYGNVNRSGHDIDYWEKKKKEFDEQQNWARTKRSRYG
jgi:hypothetical protein